MEAFYLYFLVLAGIFLFITYWLINSIIKSEEQEQQRRATQEFIMKYGTEPEKQTILLERLTEQVDQTRRAAAWWILFH
jgi:hypothetical protein